MLVCSYMDTSCSAGRQGNEAMAPGNGGKWVCKIGRQTLDSDFVLRVCLGCCADIKSTRKVTNDFLQSWLQRLRGRFLISKASRRLPHSSLLVLVLLRHYFGVACCCS